MKTFNLEISSADPCYQALADSIHERTRAEFLREKYGKSGLIMQDGTSTQDCLDAMTGEDKPAAQPVAPTPAPIKQDGKVTFKVANASRKQANLGLEVRF